MLGKSRRCCRQLWSQRSPPSTLQPVLVQRGQDKEEEEEEEERGRKQAWRTLQSIPVVLTCALLITSLHFGINEELTSLSYI